MDHDYELEDDYAPRILWGRLAFFGLALILAFAVGRCTKSSGVDESAYRAEQQKVIDLQSENEVLQAQVDAAAEGGGGANGGNNNNNNNNGGGGGGGGNDQEATEPPEESVGEGQTYTVQSGDTLTTIAEKFYGDATAFDLIVDANNLDSATGLRVGQELVIPEQP
jgi:nucleoid-associated protein YgaU